MGQSIPGVHSDPETLGGTPVFVGTRVPVRAMLDYLERDRSLAEFLDDFPTVDRALAVGVIEYLKHLGKVYQVVPDARASKDDLVRIIDESGEDYERQPGILGTEGS